MPAHTLMGQFCAQRPEMPFRGRRVHSYAPVSRGRVWPEDSPGPLDQILSSWSIPIRSPKTLDTALEVRNDAVVQPTQSKPRQVVGISRTRILVDTNIWRYLIDLDSLETVYRAAKDAHGLILACPAVLYEMLRSEDVPLRRRLVKAICRSHWVRLMPEVFEEAEEFKSEISRLRPHWLLPKPNLSEFRKFYNDWNGPRGTWWRARRDPSQFAAVLRASEGDRMIRIRDDTRELRAEIGKITTYEKVKLDTWTTTFPLKPAGWDGDPVETWRADTMRYYIEALLMQVASRSPATREWLEPWIDLTAMRNDLPSFAKMMLYETDSSHMPRSWLRWALQALQATRKTNSGTAVDNQIGSYLVDADVFVTADKVFASIVKRVADEAVVQMAVPVLVSMESCVSTLTNLLTQEPLAPSK